MRFTDWFLGDPVPAAGHRPGLDAEPSLGVIILVIGVTSWPSTARIVRAQVLSVKDRPYVERARASGGATGT